MFYDAFEDEIGHITKTGKARDILKYLQKATSPVHRGAVSAKEVGKELVEIARTDPKRFKEIAKELASGEGGQVAKGMIYGAGGISALRGLGYKDPESKRREPFEGAGRGALKGMAMGVPLALLYRYPALKRALGVP